MNVFTVSLFGHRKTSNLRALEERLTPLIEELIRANTYVAFLIGRNGEFDKYTASLIKRAQNKIGKEKCDISLILPYPVADIDYYKNYYDSVMIPEILSKAHPKSAITLKNRWMIEQSDLVIVYVEKEDGGAYAAMKYAEKLNKRIINLYTRPAYDRL